MKHNSLLLAALGSSALLPAQERPNILFICIDDLRTELGAYGCREVISPNLDRLASEGRLFHSHYVQVPTSGASRACMLTGYQPKTLGAINNFAFCNSLIGSAEGEHPETFIHHLRRNGYYTVGMGKVGHSDNGFLYPKGKERVQELPYSWDKYARDPNSPWPDKFDAMLHGYDNGRIRRPNGEDPAFEFKDLPDESYPGGQLANLAMAQIEELAVKGEPFFMAVGFYKPHLPFTAPKKYWDMYDDIDIALSPNRDVPAGVPSVFVHDSGECFNQYKHPERGGRGIVLSDAYSRDMRRAYFAAITHTDVQVGKVLAKLKETGLDQNTIIIVWGDHGWHLGDQTIWGKHSAFERALNSTLIVKMPKMEQRGVSTKALVATVDLYPTICELTGIKPPADIDGQSFVEQINNPQASGRKDVLSYWTNILSLRTDRYRFALHRKDGKDQLMLFDHQQDPNETRNIADREPQLVQTFMQRLAELNRGFLPQL